MTLDEYVSIIPSGVKLIKIMNKFTNIITAILESVSSTPPPIINSISGVPDLSKRLYDIIQEYANSTSKYSMLEAEENALPVVKGIFEPYGYDVSVASAGSLSSFYFDITPTVDLSEDYPEVYYNVSTDTMFTVRFSNHDNTSNSHEQPKWNITTTDTLPQIQTQLVSALSNTPDLSEYPEL